MLIIADSERTVELRLLACTPSISSTSSLLNTLRDSQPPHSSTLRPKESRSQKSHRIRSSPSQSGTEEDLWKDQLSWNRKPQRDLLDNDNLNDHKGNVLNWNTSKPELIAQKAIDVFIFAERYDIPQIRKDSIDRLCSLFNHRLNPIRRLDPMIVIRAFENTSQALPFAECSLMGSACRFGVTDACSSRCRGTFGRGRHWIQRADPRSGARLSSIKKDSRPLLVPRTQVLLRVGSKQLPNPHRWQVTGTMIGYL
ncbi:hypothetical protein K458DRAFT_398487 [Lentithecium fluviatile CBS 122367]|uniref:Uncharacterized protein n=1 Tax=Lentithecium fluviatile CBS 122367 TaxID=1168545 RepID=A0A6G1JNN8_9PLEO|nr:hypothetical protein K458DRAFT_398487 [Lentithecium fluviatile CBS 122367]